MCLTAAGIPVLQGGEEVNVDTESPKDFALEYLRAGLSVIPVKGNAYSTGTNPDERLKDTKAPLVNWTIYQERLPTEKEISDWFRRWPKANVAIVTGRVSGVAVIDFDSQEAIEWAAPEGLLNTALVDTARGKHAYFRYPRNGKVNNSVKVKGMSVDVRGNGGYVIAPPSVHMTGFTYRWLKGDLGRLADLPEMFTARATQSKADLKPLYRGVARGGRNDALARLCGSWLNDGLSLEECIDMARIWNGKNDPPMPEEEVKRTIQSIYRRHRMGTTVDAVYYHEKNLLRFPLFTYNKSKIHKMEKIYFSIEGQDFKREWTVLPSLGYGLPGPFDEGVFMAINKIISEMPKPVQNPINIGSLRSIARLMKLDETSGKNTVLIKESLMRLRATTIISNMTYYDANRKKFITDAFGLFDRVVLTGEDMPDSDEKAKSTFVWLNSVYLKNINVNYTSTIDFDTYLSLKGFITKGIYRFAAALMTAGSKMPIKFSYDRLADKLQIHKETHLSQVKNQLRGAHEELVEKKVFRKVSIFESGKTYIISYLP
jgi:hypothetical protein